MVKQRIKTIGDIFKYLEDYLLSIEIDKNTLKPFLHIGIPISWNYNVLDLKYNVIKIKDTNNYKFLDVKIHNDDLTSTIDNLVNDVIEMVNFNNQEQIKQNKLQQLIQKEKEKFEAKIKKLTENKND